MRILFTIESKDWRLVEYADKDVVLQHRNNYKEDRSKYRCLYGQQNWHSCSFFSRRGKYLKCEGCISVFIEGLGRTPDRYRVPKEMLALIELSGNKDKVIRFYGL